MCVFVCYYLRSSAEFAKEAMKDQNMGHGEWLNVRWATPDRLVISFFGSFPFVGAHDADDNDMF
jgi:hypothetical protein